MSGRPAEGGESSHRPALLVVLAFAYPALALASTWPLATDLDTLLPLGTLDHASVALSMIWGLWWTSDRLAHGLSGYWDAPILFPSEHVFASSEPMPLLGLLAAPLFYLGLSPVRVANLVLLAMLVLNGWMAFLLLRKLGLQRLAAALGGACVVVLPYSQREIGVLHLVPLAGILGSLWAGIGWMQRPTLSRALCLGIAVASTYLISGQYALFFVLAAAPAFVWLIRRDHLRVRPLLELAAGAGLCTALVWPVVSAELEANRLHPAMDRSIRIAQAGAALPRDFWASAWPPVVPIPGRQEPRRIDRLGLHPGSAKLALAMAGLACGFADRSRRRSTAFVASLTLGSVLLATLPTLGGGEVLERIRGVVPGLGQVRSFYRAGVFAQLASVTLAAFSLDTLLAWGRARPQRSRPATALAIVLGTLAVVDLWPRQQRFAAAPSLSAWEPWASWTRANVAADEAILYLPMFTRGRMSVFEADARWMFLQIAHGRAMVNGFWGVMPLGSRRIASEAAYFPEPRAHRVLEHAGVRWIVARPSWLRRLPVRGLDPALWRSAYQNDALDVAVYEVVARWNEGRNPSTLGR